MVTPRSSRLSILSVWILPCDSPRRLPASSFSVYEVGTSVVPGWGQMPSVFLKSHWPLVPREFGNSGLRSVKGLAQSKWIRAGGSQVHKRQVISSYTLLSGLPAEGAACTLWVPSSIRAFRWGSLLRDSNVWQVDIESNHNTNWNKY